MEKVDIIILGGGLVGLTCANLCTIAGFTTAVIEAKPPLLTWPKNSSDIRCSAISKGSQQIFEKIGVWNAITNMGVSPYQHMTVWDKLGFGAIDFDAKEVSEQNLGYIIENRIMIKALWENLLEEGTNIHLYCPAKPEHYEITNDEIILTLDNQKVLKSKLIIGADGAQSWLREKAGLNTLKRSYQQTALVATVKTELPHQKTAWQRFLPEGPLAFLPLSDPHTSSIVWTNTPENIQELLVLSESEFCETLAQNFDYRLGKVLNTSERFSFPLNMVYAKQSVAPRIALIGDAAHVIHPLAGQGVNLGLTDAQVLVETLHNAQLHNYDIGHFLVLRKYERARSSEVLTLLAAMEFFKKLFGSKTSLLAGLRSFGLNMVNNNAFLKRQFILKAMGLSS